MNIEQFYLIYQKANKISIDSRNIEKDDIFIAFSGENFDAATKAKEAIEKGAMAAIVERPEYENQQENIFYVPSTLDFLQSLAKYHRMQLKIPIIALTGSNGKTTTKELIASVLAQKYKVQFTQGNLNNHIGVPLTMLSIKPYHQIAVVEMGANHQKEIELLCEIAQPDYGYITNFGMAHLEGFGGFDGVIKGKTELYKYLKANNKALIINDNDEIQIEYSKDYSPKITFGTKKSDYHFELFQQEHQVGVVYKEDIILSQLTGAYNYTNLSVAVALGLYFEIEVAEIRQAIGCYTPNNMRSQIVRKDNKILVLDTYNANPSSMRAALDNFIKFQGVKLAILGDMLELGEVSVQEHRSILEYAHRIGIDKIITVGPVFRQINSDVHYAFEDTVAATEYLKENPILQTNILLKGSRGIGLEKLLDNII